MSEILNTEAFLPVKKSRISDNVTVQLAKLIVSGKIKEGSRLPGERELAAKLNVNRTSLREALRRLENAGLLSVRQGDGIYVCDYKSDTNLDFVNLVLSSGIGIDSELMISMDETRRFFALKMIELAAERADVDDLAELRRIAEGYPVEATPELLSGEWDFRFYKQIAVASKNRAFVHLLNTIKDLFSQMRWIYAGLDREASENVAALNLRLVKALEARNKKRAVAMVEQRMKWDQEKLATSFAAIMTKSR